MKFSLTEMEQMSHIGAMFQNVGRMFEEKFSIKKNKGILQEIIQCWKLINLAVIAHSEKWNL